MNINKFVAMQLGLASPERILEWSYGEVVKPDTLNHRTQVPQEGGLFCTKIFGPEKNWACKCKEYKKGILNGTICPNCGAKIVNSSVRRERMGHIELAAPVAHIWYLKGTPSRMSLLLNITPKQLEEIIYFVSSVIVDPKETPLQYKQVVSQSEIAMYRQQYGQDSFTVMSGADAIRVLLQQVNIDREYEEIVSELEGATGDKRKKLIKRLETFNAFKNSDNRPEWMVLTVLPVIPPDLRPMVQLDGGRFATSDLNDLYRRVITRNNRLKDLLALRAPALIVQNEKRMLQEAVDALIDNGRRGKAVSGANNRPLKSLSHSLKGKQGRFRQNLLGKRVDFSGRSVITVGPDLKLSQCGLPREMAIQLYKPFVINKLMSEGYCLNAKSAEKLIEQGNEKAWDCVEKVIVDHPVFLNRAPTLHRLGIQAFKPKLVEGRAIRLHPLVCAAFNADFDGDQMAVHLPLSEEARAEAEVLMLGSKNILGPKDGQPIVTPGQDMVLGNFYLNMERTAQEFFEKANYLEKIGEPALAKMVRQFGENEGHVFMSPNEVLIAYQNKVVHLHTRIAIVASSLNKTCFTEEQNNQYLLTTVGKVIFNDIFPSDFPYINEVTPANLKATPDKDFLPFGSNIKEEIQKRPIAAELKKGDLGKIIGEVFKHFKLKGDKPQDVNADNRDDYGTAAILDKIKDLGFKYSTIAGMTVALSDINVVENKAELVEEGQEKSNKIHELLDRGLLTTREWEQQFTALWDKVKNDMGDDLMNKMPRMNPIKMMAVSGARGNKSHFTQLAGMRGLMARPTQSKSNGEYQPSVIEVPIYSCFREGMTVSEFFISTHGVRKGLTDTALKTAESGYLTRRLVDVSQDVVIKEDDCGTTRGYLVSDIVDMKNGSLIEKFEERINGRFAMEDIVDPNTNEVLVHENEFIDENIAAKIVQAGIKQAVIRSVFTCECNNGICKKCYGRNMATGKLVELGESVGIMAAQSIGEPGTQLTMRTFHTGGVAAGNDGDITQGLPRVEELFEARNPKRTAVLSKISGTITEIRQLENSEGTVVVVSNEAESIEHKCDLTQVLRTWIKEGFEVKAGEKLTEGQVDPKELLAIAGILEVQKYILKEVKKVYALQSIEISDKHIEIIIKQMMKRVIITDSGSSHLIKGQTLSLNAVNEINYELLDNNKKPAKFLPILLGISKASVETDSFLSAASFQETTKVLTEAAIVGKKDNLNGLKENVIIGKLIPAGTGIDAPERESAIEIQEAVERIREKREMSNMKVEKTLPEELFKNAE